MRVGGAAWSLGPALLAALLFGLSARAQDLRTTVIRAPSAYHPIRDVATQVAPSLVPPKGCTPAVFRMAFDLRVAPDVTGCLPGAVEPLISHWLGMEYQVSPDGPGAATTSIINQAPSPGQPPIRGGTFILYLPEPTTTPASTPSETPAGVPGGPPTGTPTGPSAPTDGTLPTPVTSPSAPTALTRPPTAQQPPPPPPQPGPWTDAWNWFWDGLNPFWVAAGVLVTGAGLLRLINPPKPILTGTPTVSCEVAWARGASPRWRNDRHVVLNAPLIDVEFNASSPVISDAKVLDERLEP